MTRGFLLLPASVPHLLGGAGAESHRGPRGGPGGVWGGCVLAEGAISGWSQLPRRHFFRKFTFSPLIALGLGCWMNQRPIGSGLLERTPWACIVVRPMFISLPASSEHVFGVGPISKWSSVISSIPRGGQADPLMHATHTPKFAFSAHWWGRDSHEWVWRVGHLEKAFGPSLDRAGQQCPLPHPGPEENSRAWQLCLFPDPVAQRTILTTASAIIGGVARSHLPGEGQTPQ